MVWCGLGVEWIGVVWWSGEEKDEMMWSCVNGVMWCGVLRRGLVW